MRGACAWCGEEMNSGMPGTDVALPQYPEGHGLCSRCEHHLFAEWGLPLSDYLEELDIPVAVTDSDVVLRMANRAARTLLLKKLPRIEGLRAGQVFECEYALLPEGCGHTIHCGGCAIRRSVSDTFATGNSHSRVPACLNRSTPEGSTTIQFLVTTIRLGNVVALRIDPVAGQVFVEAACCS